MNNQRGILLLVLIMVIIPFVSSAPPVQYNLNADYGLEIYYPSFDVIKSGDDFNFNIRITNLSDGRIVGNDQLNCSFYLNNHSGVKIIEGNFTPNINGVGFDFVVGGGNISDSYEVFMWNVICSDTTGGSVSGIFYVTLSGVILSLSDNIGYIFVIILILGLLFSSFGLLIKDFSKEKLTAKQQFALRKESVIKHYVYLMRQRLWIVGFFGLYISLLLLSAVLTQYTYYLNLEGYTTLLSYFFTLMAWGGIPFVLFWLFYIPINLFIEVSEALKYQYGGMRDG